MYQYSRWGSKNTKKFVSLLKMHRCLWDGSIPEYKQKSAKVRACEAIARAMRIPGVTLTTLEVKNKIKNLRSTYHQEKKKIIRSREEGGPEYVPRLEWFEDFTEIISGVPSETMKNIKTEVDVTMEEPDSDTDADDQVMGDEIDGLETEYVEVNVPQYEKQAYPRQTSPRENAYENEFEVFSRSVAAQLRRMPLKNALRMQLKIQTLLTEERISLQEAEHQM